MTMNISVKALLCLAVFHCAVAVGIAQFRDSDLIVYRDPTYPFSFHYPKSWVRVEATNAATRFKAVSEAGAGQEDISIVAVANPKTKGQPPAAYFATMRKSPAGYVAALKKQNPSVRLVSHGDTTISNQPAYYIVVDFNHSAAGITIPMRQLQILTGKDGVYYTITMRGDPEKWPTLSKTFLLLATRFVFVPQ